MLLEQVHRIAVGDRQALLTAAAINGAQDYTPVDVGERVDGWRSWLNGEPQKSSGPAMADRVAAFQAKVSQFADEEVA